jgi:hypothetical protein
VHPIQAYDAQNNLQLAKQPSEQTKQQQMVERPFMPVSDVHSQQHKQQMDYNYVQPIPHQVWMAQHQQPSY